MSQKSSLGLIKGKDALDLKSLRKLYVQLTGKEPTAKEIAEVMAKLKKVKAEDAAKAKL